MPGCAKCGKEQDLLASYTTDINGKSGSFALCDECLAKAVKKEE